jgi:hypothetical protein
MSDLQTLLQETCLDLIATVFLVSGVAKLASLVSFRESLLFIPYLRVSWSYLIAWTLPATEVIVAAGLYGNLRPAKLTALTLLALFSGVVGLVLVKRLRVPCHCFGNLGSRYMSVSSLLENGALFLATIITLPLSDRVNVGRSLTTAVVVLLFTLMVRELLRQRQFLGELRKQGA